MRESNPRSPERRNWGFDPAAVPAIPDEGHLPGRELHADLVGPPRMQANTDQAHPTARSFFAPCFIDYLPFTESFLHVFARFIHDKGFIRTLIVIEQINKLTEVGFWGPENDRQILFDYAVLLKKLLHFRTDSGGTGQHADTAGRPV